MAERPHQLQSPGLLQPKMLFLITSSGKAQKDNYHSILEDNKSDFKVVFKITNSLLFCNDPSPLPPMKNSKALASEFNQFFKDKVQKIMDNLAPTEDNLTDQQYLESDYITDKRFREFIPVNSDKIAKIIRTAPPKSFELDPVPSKILKQIMQGHITTNSHHSQHIILLVEYFQAI